MTTETIENNGQSVEETVDVKPNAEVSAEAKKLTREEIGVLFTRFRKQFRLDFAEKEAKKRAKSEQEKNRQGEKAF